MLAFSTRKVSVYVILNFSIDFLTITHDLLWFIGLALWLKLGKRLSLYFPITYLTSHTILSIILYFVFSKKIWAAILAYMFTHPILLIVLAWYFYSFYKATGKIGGKILSIAYVLWAFDYIIFGVPYFGMGNKLAGVIGWNVGIVCRILIYFGFLELVWQKKVESRS